MTYKEFIGQSADLGYLVTSPSISYYGVDVSKPSRQDSDHNILMAHISSQKINRLSMSVPVSIKEYKLIYELARTPRSKR